jgi:glycosyltransferase involved in cell wall biosynthesis
MMVSWRVFLVFRELKPIDPPPLPERPLFSVLIANHNYARYVSEALDSILRQTYTNFQAIVCDDGSTDDSRDVIREYVKKDSRVKLVEQPNRGVTSAVNTAYENSRGELIALLDADDAFEPAKLERVLETLRENPRSGVCINRMLSISTAGQPIVGIGWPVNPDYGWLGPAKLREGGSSDFPPASGLSFRREVAAKLFPIPLAATRAPDYYLSNTAQFLTEVSLVPEALTLYRIHGSNTSGWAASSSAGPCGALADASLLENWARYTEEILPLQNAVLAGIYGPPAARALRLEDHWRYWWFLLAIRALRGKRAGSIRPFSASEMISHLPRPAERRLWRAISLLPDPLAGWALTFWRGPSALKRAAKSAILPLIERK